MSAHPNEKHESHNESHELRKLEYEALNREILDYSGKIYQVVTLCSGGVAAILSYTLNADVQKFPLGAVFFPFALLILPFLIILPSILLIESCMKTTARIAAYLRVFYESTDAALQWQIAMQAYRADPNGKKQRSFKRALVVVFGSLAFASVACSAFSVWGLPHLHRMEEASKVDAKAHSVEELPKVCVTAHKMEEPSKVDLLAKDFGPVFYATFLAIFIPISGTYLRLILRFGDVWGDKSFVEHEVIFADVKARFPEIKAQNAKEIQRRVAERAKMRDAASRASKS